MIEIPTDEAENKGGVKELGQRHALDAKLIALE